MSRPLNERRGQGGPATHNGLEFAAQFGVQRSSRPSGRSRLRPEAEGSAYRFQNRDRTRNRIGQK